MKNRREQALSIEDKIMAVLQLADDGGEIMSISEACRRARVNRSNLYQSYPKIVEKIRSRKRTSSIQSKTPNSKDSNARIQKLTNENKALLYLVVELTSRTNTLERQVKNAAKQKLNRGTSSRLAED